MHINTASYSHYWYTCISKVYVSVVCHRACHVALVTEASGDETDKDKRRSEGDLSSPEDSESEDEVLEDKPPQNGLSSTILGEGVNTRAEARAHCKETSPKATLDISRYFFSTQMLQILC